MTFECKPERKEGGREHPVILKGWLERKEWGARLPSVLRRDRTHCTKKIKLEKQIIYCGKDVRHILLSHSLAINLEIHVYFSLVCHVMC